MLCYSVDTVLLQSDCIQCLMLDLVNSHLSVMSMEMRKNFIQVILTSLIEKTPDAKILRTIVKIVEEWVKNNPGLTLLMICVRTTSHKAIWEPGNTNLHRCLCSESSRDNEGGARTKGATHSPLQMH